MSYNTPSISLYDLINALTIQEEERERSRRNPFPYDEMRNGTNFNPYSSRNYRQYGHHHHKPNFYFITPDGSDFDDLRGFDSDDENSDEFPIEDYTPLHYHSRIPRYSDEYQNTRKDRDDNALLKQLLQLVNQQTSEDALAESNTEGILENKKSNLGTTLDAKAASTNDVKEEENVSNTISKKPDASSKTKKSKSKTSTTLLQLSQPDKGLNQPFSPECNVHDCPSSYEIIFALPGASSKCFKVDYHPSTHSLTVKGKVDDKNVAEEKTLKISEIRYGFFQRTVKFPYHPKIDDENIKASYSNGLLQVTVPKIDSDSKPPPKKRIIIEEVPDAELEYEKHPGL